MGDIKREAVTNVLKPYFNNDAELIHRFIDCVFHQIVKSNVYRRNKTRLYNGLVFLLNFFLRKE